MIRQRILSLYLERGGPIPLADVAKDVGLSLADLELELEKSEKLDDLHGLEIRQANELIRFYGENVLFSKSVIENIEKYLIVRHKLNVIEKKAQKKGNPPSDPDESS